MNLYKTYIEHAGGAMPADVRRHYGAALSDLYHGPHSPDYWREDGIDETYSFVKSCEIVADWFDGVDWPRYMDYEGYPLTLGEAEELGDGYYEIDLRSLRQEMFGELARYL